MKAPLALAFLLAAAAACAAGPVAPPPGALLLAEDFRTHETLTKELTKEPVPLAPGWRLRVAHGIWKRTAEGLESTETPGHQPVLVVEGEFRDCVVELDFRYRTGTPAQWAACRLSATNTVLHPRAYAASVWMNGDYKSRAVGLVLEHDQWGGHVTQVARKMSEIRPDEWYTLRLQLVGDEVTASCHGVTVRGRRDTFGLPKNSLWIATGLSPHEIRRLRIHALAPGAAPAAK
jgi:hypothetical protein